jgi:hypothetical protein
VSPYAVGGMHAESAPLGAVAVEAVHRIATDSSRLTKRWYRETIGAGLTPHRLVELIGVVAIVVAVDTFARATGAQAPPLPDPRPGLPSREEPSGAVVHTAWVPTVPIEAAMGKQREYYEGYRSTLPAELARRIGRPFGNILLALSLVPQTQLGWAGLSAQMYRSPDSTLTVAQREFAATVTSSYNDCFY